ncbi:MAG: ATP-binding protein [Xenococcaceae cyanobacterium MO_234.B1]|nr:ATP-binding protein [Xenococcaceae cyanobacterium MO_234.B1]
MTSSEPEINHLIATVALKIWQSLDLSEILQATVDGLRELLKCDRVIIYRFDSNWSGIVAVESVAESRWSLLDNIIKDPCLEESWNNKYRQGMVTAIADISTATIDECHRDFLQNFDIKANLVAPILQPMKGERVEPQEDNNLWGLLIAHHCQQPRQWQESDLNCIKQIANQVAIAILQAELIYKNYQQLRQRKLAQQQAQQTRKFLQTLIEHRTEELQSAYQRLQQELIRTEQTQIALRNSEASLRESERRWRSLLENVRLLVISWDREGKIEYVNPFLLELTNYNLTEVIGKNWFTNFLSSGEQEQAKAIHNQILQPSFSSSLYYQQKVTFPTSETERTIAWNCTQLRNTQGEPIGVTCIGEDITEQQEIQKKKDEFISVVSHELRTPLTAIRGALALLAENKVAPQTEEGKHLLQIANSSSEHLVKLVNDLLELEHLESGTIELVKAEVNTKELMLRALDRVQILANKAKVEIEIVESDINFQADGDRLIQVLTNLLSNGIKFSEPNSTITLSAVAYNKPSPSILFAVQDHGRGIPSDKLESIFERFNQVDASDSKRKGGTGLGLAISRNIIEQHGGKIWAESVYGEGSTFYFTTPTK